jgi:hypothetical protein
MGNVLDPGNMLDTAGPDHVPTDFELTMASAIENAFWQLLRQDNMNTFDTDTNSNAARDRRRLLIAIAQGVVSHLVGNAAAFKVTGKDSAGQPITASISIEPGGTLLGNI